MGGNHPLTLWLEPCTYLNRPAPSTHAVWVKGQQHSYNTGSVFKFVVTLYLVHKGKLLALPWMKRGEQARVRYKGVKGVREGEG